MLGLGGPELLMVMLLVLLLFGGAKIPQLMRGLGEGMREFRKATEDDPHTTPSTTISTAPNTTPSNTINTDPSTSPSNTVNSNTVNSNKTHV